MTIIALLTLTYESSYCNHITAGHSRIQRDPVCPTINILISGYTQERPETS